MGVLRLPRPTGVYIPSSPTTRTVTTDMISPPLSPNFNFDADTLTPSVLPALEYISTKLQQRMMHVTLMAGRGKPLPTGQSSQGSDLIIIPITPLDPQSWRTFCRIVEKGIRKFSLGQGWTDALSRSQYERTANEYLVQQSILQNDILFGQEGLTVLNIDRIYTFKRRLCVLSHGNTRIPEDAYISSCVHLLRQTILDFQGRPFSKAFFHRVYEQLDVRDDLLVKVANAYKAKYGQDGIVLPYQPQSQAQFRGRQDTIARRSPVRGVRVRRQATPPGRQGTPPGAMRAGTAFKRGPKTPLSASDVTPITRNEWNILVGPPEFRQNKAQVTMWTPSPVVVAG
ncbi:hypothetical protein VTN00DRAFT_2648 [Thermoascus crustaceus]|uniref:uncharacterized protein n=1 Tax=Thermoascus crustaceus TaxID=5088 RepID=UPI0037447E3C